MKDNNNFGRNLVILIMSIAILAQGYAIYSLRENAAKTEQRVELLEQQVDSINNDLIAIFD
jgi:intracellular sulfur oxidation DsrE/DsrF family protein